MVPIHGVLIDIGTTEVSDRYRDNKNRGKREEGKVVVEDDCRSNY